MPRELPPLNALRAFEAVARLGSVSHAANELHVTHGAVSRQIHALEDALKIPLLVRQGRGLVLTPAGLRLYETASTALDQLRAVYAELRRTTGKTALVLGCPGSLLARWIIPRLDRLSRELPELRLHLSVNESIPDPSLPGLDAAFLIAEPPWPSQWQAHIVAQERIGPVISPRATEFERLRSASPHALSGISLLHTVSRPQAWPNWAAKQGLDIESLHYGTSFEHLSYLLEAALAGLGVAIAPEPLVIEDLKNGRLVAPWGFVPTPGQWALCALHRNTDPRVTALAQWLKQELNRDLHIS
ncbi:MAG: LysR family transcriptional regulator [Xanthomonadaceae bacterium]|jgi:DNA-binding transcriptional LysR family regulator|nr:LysR family transcriptional regulator [Xanthomonadaceae bacterium]